MDPFSPQSYRDTYSQTFTSNTDEGKNFYPVYENGHLQTEKKGWYSWPTQDKYQAFCRSVQTYYERENELLNKPQLIGVNREVPLFHGSAKKVRLVERDVLKARPDNYLTMRQWYDEAVSLSDASITVLHNAEVELVQLLMSKQATEHQINQAVENIITQFCRCTGKRDGDWELHLRDFMELEKQDVRVQLAIHLDPEGKKPGIGVDRSKAGEPKKSRPVFSDHLKGFEDQLKHLDSAIDRFKANPPKEVEYTRQDRMKARHSAAFDKVMQSQWRGDLEARDIRLAQKGDVFADESVQVILGEADGDLDYHLRLAADFLKARKNPQAGPPVPPEIVPIELAPQRTPTPPPEGPGFDSPLPPPMHQPETLGAVAQEQAVTEEMKRAFQTFLRSGYNFGESTVDDIQLAFNTGLLNEEFMAAANRGTNKKEQFELMNRMLGEFKGSMHRDAFSFEHEATSLEKRPSSPVVTAPPPVLKRQNSEENRLKAFEAYGNSFYGSELKDDPLNMDDFRGAQEAGLLNPQFVQLALGAWSFEQDIAFATFHTEILGLREKAQQPEQAVVDTNRLSPNTPPELREKLINEACHLFVGILGDRQYGLTFEDMKKAYRNKQMTDEMVNACLDNMKFDDPQLNALGRQLHEAKFPYKVRTRDDDFGAFQSASISSGGTPPDPDDLPPPVFANIEDFQKYLRGPSPEPYNIEDEWGDDDWQMSLSSLNVGLMGLRQDDLLVNQEPAPVVPPLATPQQPVTATKEQLEAFNKARAFNSGIKDTDLAVAVHILTTDQRLANGVMKAGGRQQEFIREFSGTIVVQAKKGVPTTAGAPVVQQTVTPLPPPIPAKRPVVAPVVAMPLEQAPMQSLRMDQMLMSMGMDDNPQVQQQFLGMKAQWDRVQPSRQQPDRAVSEKFNKHAVKAGSFEEAEQDLIATHQQLLAEIDMPDDIAIPIKADMERAHRVSKIKLKYQFGEITKAVAQQQIRESTQTQLEAANELTDLDRITPFKPTLISADEEAEFELLNNVVTEMYKRQAAGNSNCQGFANSLEHFARGRGYNQVQAVSVAIELPYDNGQTSPITGWYQFDALEEQHHHHQFQDQTGAFFEAIKKGQQRHPGARKRVLGEAFDSDRYVVLKSGTGGGAGHYTFVQRLKSSGRFIVLDAQNRQMFPVLNPDGTPTDEAKAFFNNVSIQAYSPEVLSDEKYDLEIKGANLCLASDRNYGHLIGVFEHLDKVPKQSQRSIDEAADWLSRNVNGAPVRAEIIKGLERAPGRELWPSLWDGTYQLKRPSEVEPLKRRFDAFDPKKGVNESRYLVRNLSLLPAEQRQTRRMAFQAFQRLRASNVQIDNTMKDALETNFNAAFPTEREWNQYCGPDVDIRVQGNIDRAEQQVLNAQPIRNPEAMKQLMDHLWQLSPRASESRRLAAEELVQLCPELQLNPVDVEADLSRCFSEDGWDFLWGGLNLKRSQLISLQMRMDWAQVSRPREMKALMDEMLKVSDRASNDIRIASGELAQIRPDLGLSAAEIERNLRKAFPGDDWKMQNRALRGRAKEVKDDIKLNLMGRGRQVMTWGQNVQVPPAQAATVPPVEVKAPEEVQAVPEPVAVRESRRVEKSQNIREVLTHIKPGEPVVVCFDLDETLIAKDVVEGGRHQRRVVNPDTAKIIQDIRTKAGPGNAKIILLTANDEDSLREKLEITKLDRNLFDDAITIKVQTGPLKTKGQGLHHYLDKSQHPAQHIVMVDDVQGMLESVEMAADQRKIPYTTLHFYGAKPMVYRVDFANTHDQFPEVSFQRFIELQQLAEEKGWNSDDMKSIYVNESATMRHNFDQDVAQRRMLRLDTSDSEWRNFKLPKEYRPPAGSRPVIGFKK
ncbi:HAD family hydrolase [Endozoicomonas arenosclerae]|uniref:HAD family hydrolase n=1 Tax=Endozoicomonas arenosclerae TaxID=1633495 RepID=UPI0007819A83|nr:HAD family hydrolase [Endozoicomonas arenosclerae]